MMLGVCLTLMRDYRNLNLGFVQQSSSFQTNPLIGGWWDLLRFEGGFYLVNQMEEQVRYPCHLYWRVLRRHATPHHFLLGTSLHLRRY